MKTYQLKDSCASTIYNLDVEPRVSVRLYGENPNRVRYIRQPDGKCVAEHYAQPFDLTFKIGDHAVYGSYNLTYTGKIVAIGEKTITINASGTGEKCKWLTWDNFAWRNWDYDADKIAADNAEERMYI